MSETLIDLAWTIAYSLVVIVPLLLVVAYYTYAERKIIGYIQVRMGPNRVGYQGLLQPIADAAKLAFKEIIIPSGANKVLFILAPIVSMGAAIAAWAVVPYNDGWVLADVNAGLLPILPTSLTEATDAFQKALVAAALEQSGGKRTQAAELLGVSRQWLHRLIARWDTET